MMRAVIRNGNESLHLIGHVDGYNLESLRDHTRAMGADGHLSLMIEVSPKEQEQLQRQAGRWLRRLAATGASVVVRPALQAAG